MLPRDDGRTDLETVCQGDATKDPFCTVEPPAKLEVGLHSTKHKESVGECRKGPTRENRD